MLYTLLESARRKNHLSLDTSSKSTRLFLNNLQKFSMKFFLLTPKIGMVPGIAFLLQIFRNVDGSWRVTSKLRGSTLIQVARRRSKVFQRFSASLARVGDVQGVSRQHAVRGKKKHTQFIELGRIFRIKLSAAQEFLNFHLPKNTIIVFFFTPRTALTDTYVHVHDIHVVYIYIYIPRYILYNDRRYITFVYLFNILPGVILL